MLLLLLLPLQWGADINPGMGPQLLLSVQDDLAAIVRTENPADLIARFVQKHGAKRIEAVKRFRNPELRPLFHALLDVPDWHVQHRALLALEYVCDPLVVRRAWGLLEHPNRRLRERAALTILKVWDGKLPPPLLAMRLREERDFFVRRCLEALERRRTGKLPLERVSTEFVKTYQNGLVATPWLSGLRGLRAKRKVQSRQGKGPLPTADRWVAPLLGWGEEEVAGVSLQPFANPRAGGRVHTGVDVGACLDGAGFYAAAAGVVRLIHTGSDMGTLIVVEHKLEDGRLVNAVYMHGGDTVFVRPGERVTCGQLLTTMGLGFSAENGGHFAHLHFGLYPGPFSMTHNYGYKLGRDGLRDWFDPSKVLPRWIARTAPLLDESRRVDRGLAGVTAKLRAGQFGKAFAGAVSVRNRAEPGSDLHVDAVYLIGKIEQVPGRVHARAQQMREQGFPRLAAGELRTYAATCKGIRGADRLGRTLAAWEADPLFKKALEGDGRLESAYKRSRKLDPKRRRALWEKLLKEYGRTCLRPRIEAQLR